MRADTLDTIYTTDEVAERLRLTRRALIKITAGFVNAQPDGEENPGAWHDRRKAKRAVAKERSDQWAEKKRKALEDFRAKKAAEARAVEKESKE